MRQAAKCRHRNYKRNQYVFYEVKTESALSKILPTEICQADKMQKENLPHVNNNETTET
jgi:hypothetical protein